MTIKETIDEINGIIASTPYSKEEIASLWKAEDEHWDYNLIVSMAVAYEYLHQMDNPKTEHLRGKYLRLLDEMKERYAERTPSLG